MGDVFYLKVRDGNYFDEQKDSLLSFIDEKKYQKICFLVNTIKNMDDHNILGQALVRHWGQANFDHFKKGRAIKFDTGQQFSYGTVKTLGSQLQSCEVIVHVYAYSDSFLKAFENTYTSDHVFVYWVNEQPELDEWVSILHGENIGPTENIQPISLDLAEDVLSELSRIRSVNVSDGGTHTSDERLIKEVVQKVNKKGKVIDSPTFKSFLIHNIKFRPHHAEKAAYKVRRYL